jgi:hypothetical protein
MSEFRDSGADHEPARPGGGWALLAGAALALFAIIALSAAIGRGPTRLASDEAAAAGRRLTLATAARLRPIAPALPGLQPPPGPEQQGNGLAR